MLEFNKLRGRIKEFGYTENQMADLMGIGANTLSMKFNGKSDFTKDEISKITKILKIPQNEIGSYFFLEI